MITKSASKNVPAPHACSARAVRRGEVVAVWEGVDRIFRASGVRDRFVGVVSGSDEVIVGNA